jgi:mannose-6-phosphate isomerase-like protein (cupin superfamily)
VVAAQTVPAGAPTITRAASVDEVPAPDGRWPWVLGAVTVSASADGSRIQFGVHTVGPGGVVEWSTLDHDDEAPGVMYRGSIDYICFVLSGSVEFEWDGAWERLVAGDTLFLPPGRKYKMRNTEPVPARYVYAITPPYK